MTNFPEIWLNRVIQKLTSADKAPWLAGIAELDVPVAELGAGSQSETNTIHIPQSTFEPDVLLNNTTYPLAVQEFTDGEVTLNLDKYQTKPTSLTDDQIIGASYPRIDSATASHVTAILKKKYGKAINAIAPSADSANTPVILTTGAGAASGDRNPLTYADLVTLKAKFDAMDCPMDGRRLVLCSDHLNDLLLDRQNFGNLLYNYQQGQPVPAIAGFSIFSYINNPYYAVSNSQKVAYAATPGANDHQGSVAFYAPNIALKTGLTKQYFKPANADPENQMNLLNYRHYYIALPMLSKYVGAIMSGNKA